MTSLKPKSKLIVSSLCAIPRFWNIRHIHPIYLVWGFGALLINLFSCYYFYTYLSISFIRFIILIFGIFFYSLFTHFFLRKKMFEQPSYKVTDSSDEFFNLVGWSRNAVRFLIFGFDYFQLIKLFVGFILFSCTIYHYQDPEISVMVHTSPIEAAFDRVSTWIYRRNYTILRVISIWMITSAFRQILRTIFRDYCWSNLPWVSNLSIPLPPVLLPLTTSLRLKCIDTRIKIDWFWNIPYSHTSKNRSNPKIRFSSPMQPSVGAPALSILLLLPRLWNLRICDTRYTLIMLMAFFNAFWAVFITFNFIPNIPVLYICILFSLFLFCWGCSIHIKRRVRLKCPNYRLTNSSKEFFNLVGWPHIIIRFLILLFDTFQVIKLFVSLEIILFSLNNGSKGFLSFLRHLLSSIFGHTWTSDKSYTLFINCLNTFTFYNFFFAMIFFSCSFYIIIKIIFAYLSCTNDISWSTNLSTPTDEAVNIANKILTKETDNFKIFKFNTTKKKWPPDHFKIL